ncbi:class I SAM-dependent methyltransferase [candidate division KSB1 bacterium]|nr:class I SAM-dependent methyltransferase [candidate division KSB1 bacterium]
MNEEWKTIEHALNYLGKADRIPHRTEGESALLEEISSQSRRILDIGAGDGRLLKLLLLKCPNAYGIALDFSPVMLSTLREQFDDNNRVKVIEHDINNPLPSALGEFDVIVSSFSIHHLSHNRKFNLYTEIFNLLESGGIFCNLEHIASPTQSLHNKFFELIGMEEDTSNKLLDVETQLQWLRETGFDDVDCYWKWRELALLIGIRR